MKYIGLHLDNDELRRGLLALGNDCHEIVDALSNIRYDSEYKLGGQRRGKTVDELRADLEKSAAQISHLVSIDLETLKKGIDDHGIADPLPQNKVSMVRNPATNRLRNDYLDACITPSNVSLIDSISAVFLHEDLELGSIRVTAMKVGALLSHRALPHALNSMLASEAAIEDARAHYSDDMAKLVRQLYSSGTAPKLGKEARSALDRRTLVWSEDHTQRNDQPRIFFSFYHDGSDDGCHISNEFNFLRGEKQLDLNLQTERDRDVFEHILVSRLGIGANEITALANGICERMPLAPQPHKRDEASFQAPVQAGLVLTPMA